MNFLHSVVSIPMIYVVAAIIVGASLLALWLTTLLSRRWYVTIRKSEETELMAVYFARIADAVERIAANGSRPIEPEMSRRSQAETSDSDEHQLEPVARVGARRPVGVSMFGL